VPVERGECTEERFFGAIAESGARALLIGRRAMVALGIPVLNAAPDRCVRPGPDGHSVHGRPRARYPVSPGIARRRGRSGEKIGTTRYAHGAPLDVHGLGAHDRLAGHHLAGKWLDFTDARLSARSIFELPHARSRGPRAPRADSFATHPRGALRAARRAPRGRDVAGSTDRRCLPRSRWPPDPDAHGVHEDRVFATHRPSTA